MRILSWDKETITKLVANFSDPEKLKLRNPSAYRYAEGQGLLEELFPGKIEKRRAKWTVEQLAEEAKKYQTRTEFVTSCPAAYHAAYIRGILDLICGHMIEKRHDWTEEEIETEAKKYKTRSTFYKGCSKAYTAAREMGILDKVCSHMVRGCELNRPSVEEMKAEAAKYTKRTIFAKNAGTHYRLAVSLGILDDICSHMDGRKSSWKVEELKEVALRYKTKKQFQELDSGAYQAAYARGIIKEICAHMNKNPWGSKEELIAMIKKESVKHKTRRGFRLGSPTLYQKASTLKILNEVCSHMTK